MENTILPRENPTLALPDLYYNKKVNISLLAGFFYKVRNFIFTSEFFIKTPLARDGRFSCGSVFVQGLPLNWV
jgi:hypothetical protein